MENGHFNNLESKENISPNVEIVSEKELVSEIYKGESSPQDKRFLHTKHGGVFKYFHLEEIVGINSYGSTEKLYPKVTIGNEIAGLAELEQDPNNNTNYWIKFVSVDPKFQGRGYASLLIKKIFEFAKENNYSLEPSFYSEEGELKLKKVMDKAIKESGVMIIDRLK